MTKYTDVAKMAADLCEDPTVEADVLRAIAKSNRDQRRKLIDLIHDCMSCDDCSLEQTCGGKKECKQTLFLYASDMDRVEEDE